MTTKSNPKQSQPSRRPQNVNESAWFCENRGSIDVYIQTGAVTARVRIPWAKLLKSVKRCGRKLS
jgi:hypothetical protein